MIQAAPAKLLQRIHHLSQFRQRALTLKQLFDFGLNPTPDRLLTQARFLQQELPVRLSHRVKELENLPFGLSEMPSVRLLTKMYVDSIQSLIEFVTPLRAEDELRFTRLIEGIKQRHNNVVSIMAKGILELKASRGSDALKPEIQAFLDRFYMSRIGIRMLIGQHVALHESSTPGYVGLICERCCPATVLQQAMSDAQSLCLRHYSFTPAVQMYGNLRLDFTYVPSHLHHMLFELLKNSLRAVAELHGPRQAGLPQIRVVFAEGEEDITIKISDEGGGIPRSGVSQIWTYLYTTASPPALESSSPYYQSDFHAPLAGLGYGLPISRLYARYFGGDLQVISMEGYGTDTYLHLKRLGDEKELLPRKLR